MNLLATLEASSLGAWIRESEWGYPIVLICHTVGMALVGGGVLIFAIRAAQSGTDLRANWFKLTFRLSWAGFAMSLVSGFILFASAPQRFIAHPMFQIKLGALLLGAVLLRFLTRLLAATANSATANSKVRWLGGSSALLWFIAIAAGRLMAYIR